MSVEVAADSPRRPPADRASACNASARALVARRHSPVRGASSAKPGSRDLPALSGPLEAVPQADRRPRDRLLALLGGPDRRLHHDIDGADPYSGAYGLSAAAFRYGRHP